MPSFRWQDHAQDLLREVANSYAKGENMDCVFETNGGLIKGHKLILTAVSPYFKQLFKKHIGSGPILLKQVKYCDLRIVLDFVYSGSIDIPVSEVSSFIRTANLLQITPFQKLYCSNGTEKPSFVENDGAFDDRITKEGEKDVDLSQNAGDMEKNDPAGYESITHPSFETILLPSVEAVMAVQKRKRRGKIRKPVPDCQSSSPIVSEMIVRNNNEQENGKNVLSEGDKNNTLPPAIDANDDPVLGTTPVTETSCKIGQSTEEPNDKKKERGDCDNSSGINPSAEETVESTNTSSVIAASSSGIANSGDDLTKRLRDTPDSFTDVGGSRGMDTSENSCNPELKDNEVVEQIEEDVNLESLRSMSELDKEVENASLDLSVNKELSQSDEEQVDVKIKEDNSWTSGEENAMVDEGDTDMETEIGEHLNADAVGDPLDPLVDNTHSIFGSTQVSTHSEMLLGSQDFITEEQRTQGEAESYRCFLCVAVFSAKSDYEHHFNSHINKKIHRCNVCSSTFRFKSLLERHVRIHTKDKTLYTCDICKAAFYSNSDLKTHLRTHTGVKPYPCNLCDAGFNYKCVLKRHLRTHTGERPYSCNICQATFVESGTLKYHLRTHTGEKPYACTICQAAFTKRDSLKTHMRIHSGEKPYSCSICQINFTYKSTLRRHMRMHKE